MSDREKRIIGFDGLRAVSIFFVLCSHLDFYTGKVHPKIIPLINGSTGVQIFFVLSGYLITTLLIYEQNNNNFISLKNFYIRRALRILPCYMSFLLTVTVLYFNAVIKVPVYHLILSYVYLSNYITDINEYSRILGHTWSLSVEEHFYMIWPLLFICFQRRILFVASLLLFFIALPLEYYLSTNLKGWLGYFSNRWSLPAASSILMGCSFAIFYNSSKKSTFWSKRWSQIMILVLSIAFYTANLWLPAENEILFKYIRCFGIALFVQWIVCNQSSFLVEVLNIRPLAFLGKISYGIYIWQGFYLLTGPGNEQIWPQYFPQNIVLTIVTAVISYYYIEKPFLRKKAKFKV